jgi:hypothetical protein
MGVPSDPTKVATMRAMDRQLALCSASPQCAGASESALRNFSRYWIKNSEHTWGVSVQHFGILQKIGWNNSVFRPALADPEVSTYRTLQDSWVDQMKWGADWALEALPRAHPMQRALAAEFEEIAPGRTNASDGSSWLQLPPGTMQTVLRGFEIGWDNRGAIVHLAASGNVSWASQEQPLALLRYQSLSDATFGTQMRQSYLFRHPDDVPGSSPRVSGANEYGKPGVDESAHPLDQVLTPTLRGVFRTAPGSSSGGVEQLLLDLVFPPSAVEHYGAPASALLTLTPAYPILGMRLELVDKQPTRLPEATWLQFSPLLSSGACSCISDRFYHWVGPYVTYVRVLVCARIDYSAVHQQRANRPGFQSEICAHARCRCRSVVFRQQAR